MKVIVGLLLMLQAGTLMCRGAQWFVATNGTGNGSFSSPWALQTAMASTAIRGGDTVWLRGGIYTPPADSTNQPWSRYLNYGHPGWGLTVGGTGTNRITYRSYTSEWAAIDCPILMPDSICFRDLEFFDSLKGIRNTNDPADWNYVYTHFIQNGTNNQWINCLIHDIDDGGFGGQAHGANTLRGCILWYIGWNYREHVFYPMVAEFSGSIMAWPLNRTLNNSISDFICNSNIIFGSGAQWSAGTAGPERSQDLAPGGNRGTIIGNVVIGTYQSLCGGFTAGSVVSSNIFTSPDTPVYASFTSNSVFSYNTLFDSKTNSNVVMGYSGGLSNAMDYNSYCGFTNANYANLRFIDLSTQRYTDLAGWQTNYGFDLHSTANLGKPPDTVRVMVNADEPKRAHIAVCNWSRQDNASVSLAGVLSRGDTYRLFSAQNYKAGPIQTGTYNGSSISVPMTNLTVVPMIYGTNLNMQLEILSTPPLVSPEFGAFVVIGEGTLTPATGLHVIPAN